MWLAPIIALALAAGDPPDAAPAPAPDAAPAPAPDAEAAPAPKPTFVRLAGLRPTRLPDGTFGGALEGVDGTLEVSVVNGFVTKAIVRRGDKVIALRPTVTPDDLGLKLGGRDGDEFIKLSGAFWDADYGNGAFDGTLAKKKVQGTWRLARR